MSQNRKLLIFGGIGCVVVLCLCVMVIGGFVLLGGASLFATLGPVVSGGDSFMNALKDANLPRPIRSAPPRCSAS